jgi:uncharacterized membrane protein
LGLAGFVLALVRGEGHGPGMILDGFNNFFRAFGLFFLNVVFITLWSLPVIIPGLAVWTMIGLMYPFFQSPVSLFTGLGIVMILLFFAVVIIAVLAYSQSFLLLADEPRHGVGSALYRSRRLMKGNKRKLFRLVLSFIGWIILVNVVSFVVGHALDYAPFAVRRLMTPVLDGVVTAPVHMYMAAAVAIFHDILMGRVRPAPFGDGPRAEMERPVEKADRLERPLDGYGPDGGERRDDEGR